MEFRIYSGNYYAAPIKFVKHDHEEGYWEEITSESETVDQWAVYHQPEGPDTQTTCIAEFWGEDQKENALLFLYAKAPKATYWIFGSDLCRAYSHGTQEAPLKEIFAYFERKSIGGMTFVWDDGKIGTFLSQYQGWNDCVQVSKEEYEQIEAKFEQWRAKAS